MSAKTLILGANGQLGRAFAELLGDQAVAVARDKVDLTSPHFTSALDEIIANQPVTAVINAAAYTQVDKAEGEGRIEAMRVNGEAVGELAAWCKARNLPLVHFSTDYVFDGTKAMPYAETDEVAPLNIYGESKLAGERAIAACGEKYLIFRTSWVYDAYGKNFFNTMLRLFAEKEMLNVVSDQIGAPTYAPHLAKAAWDGLQLAAVAPAFPSGVYHLCANGATSWHGFAEAILKLARSNDSRQKSSIRCKSVIPIPSAQYPVPAARPANSRLDCAKALNLLGAGMPSWETGLKACFEEKYGR